MQLPQIDFAGVKVSRIAVGGNPFSGIGHQDAALDKAMKDYYTVARIKDTLFQCEELGINTAFMRADAHIMRMLREYWNEGGKIQWFAQHAPEHRNWLDNIKSAKGAGATGIYIQGGLTDTLQEAGKLDGLREALTLLRQLRVVSGLAGHQPKTHLDCQTMGLDYDFHMVCFYNLTGRRGKVDVADPNAERYRAEDRKAAANLLRDLKRPCVAYKIMGAGRNDPREAISYAVRHLKPTDIVCIGFFPKHRPNEVRDDIEIFCEALAGQKT
ncbi:MAG: hypothetical protein FJ291_16730 [Planctomycetes bacterium]|nr:hypothetical protein [Planctomycetota bacterium]